MIISVNAEKLDKNSWQIRNGKEFLQCDKRCLHIPTANVMFSGEIWKMFNLKNRTKIRIPAISNFIQHFLKFLQ